MQPPPHISAFPKLATGNDDKSTTTTNTITLDAEEFIQMKEEIKELQEKDRTKHKEINTLKESFKKTAINTKTNNAKIKKSENKMDHILQDVTQLQQTSRDLNQNFDTIHIQQQEMYTHNTILENRQSTTENKVQKLEDDFQTRQKKLETQIATNQESLYTNKKSLDQIMEFLLHNPPTKECTTSKRSAEMSTITSDTAARKAKRLDNEHDESTAESTFNPQDDDDPDVPML